MASAQVLEVLGEAIAASARPKLRAAVLARQQEAALAQADASAVSAPPWHGTSELGTTTAAWRAWLASLRPLPFGRAP